MSPPCRIVDTRNLNGPFGGPFLAANTTRAFVVSNSACGIPAARAYAVNVTVVPHGFLGYLAIWPSADPQPLVSTLNSYDGRTKANAAIVPADRTTPGPVGPASISVFATNDTDVILDVSGYFVAASGSSALGFFALAPCRVLDTRNAVAPLGGPSLVANSERRLPILSSTCNIPSSARAYSMNFTIVPRGPLGYLSAWPSDKARPLVSILNGPTGRIVANAAIVPAASNGDISVFSTDTADLVIDVNGYFAPASTRGTWTYGIDPTWLYAVTPCRLLDTRNPPNTRLNGTLQFYVPSSNCNIGNDGPYVLNATVVPTGALNYLTLWPREVSQPFVSTLNADDGFVTSNMALLPAPNGWINAFATQPTDLILDISGYFRLLDGVQLTTTSLPGGTVGTSYTTTTLQATGGLSPYTWGVTGQLPTGMTLSSSGVLSGTPTSSGTFTPTIKVTDSQTPGAFASKQFSFTIASVQQTITLSPTINGLVSSNLDGSFANTAYPNQSAVSVGQEFYGGFLCGNGSWASLARFNLSGLQGKTIDSATLILTADSAPVGYYPKNFEIGVAATSWNPATVTWNVVASQSFLYYTSAWSSVGPQFKVLNYPTYPGQVYNIDAKYVLQNWLSGYFANDGLLFQSVIYNAYCTISLDTYTLIPSLKVTYH